MQEIVLIFPSLTKSEKRNKMKTGEKKKKKRQLQIGLDVFPLPFDNDY